MSISLFIFWRKKFPVIRLAIKRCLLLFGKVATFLLSKRSEAKISGLDIFFVLERPLGLGDIVMLYPKINALAGNNPKRRVSIVSDYQCFIKNKNIKWFSPDQITKECFDQSLFIFPDFNFRSIRFFGKAKHSVGYMFSNKIYSSIRGSGSEYDLTAGHYVDRLDNIFDFLGWDNLGLEYCDIQTPKNLDVLRGLPQSFFCIAPFSLWETRQYNLNYFREIIAALTEYLPVVLLGGPSDRERIADLNIDLEDENIFDLIGRLSLFDLEAVLARCEAYIGNDSGPTHLANLFAQRSVSIFGCCDPETRMPKEIKPGVELSVFSRGRECRHFPCFNGLSEPRCKHSHKYLCMDVDPQAVVRELVGKKGAN